MIFHVDGTGQGIRGHLVPVFHTADGVSVANRLPVRVTGTPLVLIEQTISRINLREIAPEHRNRVTFGTEFQKEVGHMLVVETGPEDKIVWAQRIRRKLLSRMVEERNPPPSNHFTVVLKRIENGEDPYALRSAYIGEPLEAEPDDYRELLAEGLSRETRRRVYQRSRIYWATHAFTMCARHWPESVTTECPVGWGNAPGPSVSRRNQGRRAKKDARKQRRKSDNADDRRDLLV